MVSPAAEATRGQVKVRSALDSEPDVEKLGDVWDVGFNLVMGGTIMVCFCLSGSGAKGRPQREAIIILLAWTDIKGTDKNTH